MVLQSKRSDGVGGVGGAGIDGAATGVSVSVRTGVLGPTLDGDAGCLARDGRRRPLAGPALDCRAFWRVLRARRNSLIFRPSSGTRAQARTPQEHRTYPIRQHTSSNPHRSVVTKMPCTRPPWGATAPGARSIPHHMRPADAETLRPPPPPRRARAHRALSSALSVVPRGLGHGAQ